MPVQIIVLMPTRGVVSSELVLALINNTQGYELILRTVDRRPVDVARNRLAALAIRIADDIALFPPDANPYVLWIDSDAFFLKGTLDLMIHTLEANPSIDLLTALFGPRAANAGATAFRSMADPSSFLVPDVNFVRGEVIDVESVGLHFALHRVSLLKALGAEPFGDAQSPETDDAAFCGRIRFGNGRISVATGIPVFHVDERNGAAYSPGIPACVINGDVIDPDVTARELTTEKRSYGPRIDAILKSRAASNFARRNKRRRRK